MAEVTLRAVAATFGRDVPRCVEKAVRIVEEAIRDGVDLLVLPHATLGGYLADLHRPGPDDLPPALDPDGPELAAIVEAAGALTVCLGYTELRGDARYNSAVALTGDGVLGVHRKVHQVSGEAARYAAGDSFDPVDTPAGRIGMLIDFDKTFPESVRSLALGGADVVCALSAWPASVTMRSARLPADRQSRMFDLYDCARAAENQVFVVSSNLTGTSGELRFLGQAKIVGPGGDVLATTRSKGGVATVTVDVAEELARARRVLHHLSERRPTAYRSTTATPTGSQEALT